MSGSIEQREGSLEEVGLLSTFRAIAFIVWNQSIGRNVFKSYLLPLAGVFCVSYFLVLRPNPESFADWVFGFFTLKGMPLLALSVSGALLRDEIKDGTIEYLRTRPAGKVRLAVSFYLSAVIKTVILGGAITLTIYLAGLLKGCEPELATLVSLFLGQLCSALAFCSGGILLASWSGKYMVLGVFYGSVIELGIGSIPTNVSKLSITHHIERIATINSFDVLVSSWSHFLVCAVLASVCLFVTCIVFTMKSYSLGHEKES